MRILIIHYRFFETGGPERYLFNIIEQLEMQGHTVIPFSVKHNSNIKSEYSKYFVSPIGNGDITYSNQVGMSIKGIFQSLARHFFSFEAQRKLNKLIKDFSPDLAYLLQYQSKLSPSILWSLKKYKIPVVQRVSDYNHFCANNIFYNYKLQKPCTKCIQGSLLNALKYKCVESSFAKSLIRTCEIKLHNLLKVRNKIDHFVIPSKFTLEKFCDAGESRTKLTHIPTFFNINRKVDILQYDEFALYVGRFDEDKGVRTLIDAFVQSKKPLVVIGDSSNELATQIIERANQQQHNIQFLGKLPFKDVQYYLSKCLFAVCPSIWYENFPNTILEAFAFEKAVVASNIGSLGELVIDQKTGLLFEPGDSGDLVQKCEIFFVSKESAMSMGKEAYRFLNTSFGKSTHLERLNSLFDTISRS